MTAIPDQIQPAAARRRGSSWRALPVITVVLLGQALLLRYATLSEAEASILPLAEVPQAVGSWQMTGESVMDESIFNYLKPDDYISRQYATPGAAAPLDLFVAYFRSLNQSYGPHSPKICLPGAGWLTRSSEIVEVAMPGWPTAVPVNQIYMEKNQQRILVLYWYQNKRHAYADEVMAKLYLMPDMLRHQRSDVALVRIIAPLTADREAEGRHAVRDQMMEFVKVVFPVLKERFSG